LTVRSSAARLERGVWQESHALAATAQSVESAAHRTTRPP
jgi:hypothetical protein